jgi:HAD superfamily hydrolase (TIGR01509 family)
VSPRDGRDLRAVLWDVDGTMAETERDAHRVAFNIAFERFSLPHRWSVEHYGALLAVAGGRERLLHDMAAWHDAPPGADAREALARALHAEKSRHYVELLRSDGLPLRPGVLRLMEECSARGVLMAITTTTSRDSLHALLRHPLGDRWGERFAVQLCGEDVQRKKPDPEVYREAAARLGVAPDACVALEDSPAGLASAIGAHVPVVITRSVYFPTVEMHGAAAVGPGLHTREGWSPPLADASSPTRDEAGVGLDDLATWCGMRPPR